MTDHRFEVPQFAANAHAGISKMLADSRLGIERVIDMSSQERMVDSHVMKAQTQAATRDLEAALDLWRDAVTAAAAPSPWDPES